jgi:hypothetical protein
MTGTVCTIVRRIGNDLNYSVLIRRDDGLTFTSTGTPDRIMTEVTFWLSNGWEIVDDAPKTSTQDDSSVVPGSIAAILENLGFVELLAGMPDLSKSQSVRWNLDRMHQVSELVCTIERRSS